MDHDKMKLKCLEVTTILKAMAHPQRLMIMCHLAEGEKSVSELMDLCGDISQSQMSQFLTRMQRERLLKIRKEGNFIFYSIADANALKLVAAMHKIFCR